MIKVLYQIEFKNKLGTRRSPVYEDLENVIESLEYQGFERVYEGIDGDAFKITEVIDNYVTEEINTLAIIHEVPYYEGRMAFPDHVYLKDEGEN